MWNGTHTKRTFPDGYLGGKSAVLSGITIALGGKANSTGRGNGLKSFIREGQPYVFIFHYLSFCILNMLYSAAEVTIHIKNRGSEAYRHEDYGDSIVITRRFTKDGSASWKIKSADDRLISSKKDEVAAISDHMSIQVSVYYIPSQPLFTWKF